MNKSDSSLLRYLQCATDVELKIVQSLLNDGANINECNYYDHDHFMPLFCAVIKPNTSLAVIELLLRNGTDVDIGDIDYCTALMHAAKNPNIRYEVIELLLRNGASVHKSDDYDCTALIYAVRNPNASLAVIELLLRNGADVRRSDNNDCTALIYAVRNPNASLEVIELLLNNGATVNDRKYSVLHDAIRNPNTSYEVIKLLLKKGVDVHEEANDGCIPILYAAKKRITDLLLMELLLRYATDYHVQRRNLGDCRGCLPVLKYIVLERVRNNPRCINDFFNCMSVLGNEYFQLFAPHFSRSGFAAYVENCVLEITQMKKDHTYPLLFPSSPINESPFDDPSALVQRLRSIWSRNRYPLYLDVIHSEVKSKDLFDLLGNFRIYRRSSLEGKVTSLHRTATLLVVEYITVGDMLRLLEAFYSPPEKVTKHLRDSSRNNGCVINYLAYVDADRIPMK